MAVTKAGDTVTTSDSVGHEFEVEVGADGKNPVSVNNPPAKAIAGYSNPDTDESAPKTAKKAASKK